MSTAIKLFGSGNLPFVPDPTEADLVFHTKYNERWLLLAILAQLVGGYQTPASPAAQLYAGATAVSATVTSTAAALVASSATARCVSIANNSAGVITIAIGATPVADTGTPTAPNGDGFGIAIPPGGLWESPRDFKEAVNAIALASAKATVSTFTRA